MTKKVPAHMGGADTPWPMPTVLVGANMDGRPTFMTAAWVAFTTMKPTLLSVCLVNRHYTLKGIKQNMTFSVNTPSLDQIAETDFCGITSGNRGVDKVKSCGFKVFYGKLGNAPLIEQCPAGIECRVVHLLELGDCTMVIGSIEDTHVDEDCVTDGRLDASKLRPFLYVTGPGQLQRYYDLGEVVGKCFRVGREIAKKMVVPVEEWVDEYEATGAAEEAFLRPP